MSRLKNVREQRDALAKQNVELGVRSFAQSEGTAKFAGKMFTLAGEWDAKEAELEGDIETLENKLVLEKQNTENANRITQLTRGALAFANAETRV